MKTVQIKPLMAGFAVLAALTFAGSAAYAQTTNQDTGQASSVDPTPNPAPGMTNPLKDASPAQLQREHNRAVKAGDSANDPMNPASSNALNQAQLQGAPLPAGATPDAGGPAAMPPAASPPPAPQDPNMPAPANPPANPPASTDSGTNSGMDNGATPQ